VTAIPQIILGVPDALLHFSESILWFKGVTVRTCNTSDNFIGLICVEELATFVFKLTHKGKNIEMTTTTASRTSAHNVCLGDLEGSLVGEIRVPVCGWLMG
jgi:hypothetical protein